MEAAYNAVTGVWTITGSVASVNAALAAVTFVPAPNSNTGVTITTHIVDAAGAGPADGAIAITILPSNDAPVLAAASPALTGITEDSVNNGGQTVGSFANAAISDVDAGAFKGIAITARTGGNESWQYSTDGGAHWTNVGAVSNASALLLRETDLVQFQPNTENGANATLTYRAWDQTSGVFATKVDTTTNGGGTAFSTTTNTATLAVSNQNDIATITTTSLSVTETDLAAPVSFNIASKVSITDVDTDDSAAPHGYVANSGTVTFVGQPTPPSGSLGDLLTFDAGTGQVSFDKSAFNWLKNGETVVYTHQLLGASRATTPRSRR